MIVDCWYLDCRRARPHKQSRGGVSPDNNNRYRFTTISTLAGAQHTNRTGSAGLPSPLSHARSGHARVAAGHRPLATGALASVSWARRFFSSRPARARNRSHPSRRRAWAPRTAQSSNWPPCGESTVPAGTSGGPSTSAKTDPTRPSGLDRSHPGRGAQSRGQSDAPAAPRPQQSPLDAAALSAAAVTIRRYEGVTCRKSRRRIFPVTVMGRASRNSISRGYSCAERRVRTNA